VLRYKGEWGGRRQQVDLGDCRYNAETESREQPFPPARSSRAGRSQSFDRRTREVSQTPQVSMPSDGV